MIKINYEKLTIHIPKISEIIDEANRLIDQGKYKEAEQKLNEIANVQIDIQVNPIYSGVYSELRVDA